MEQKTGLRGLADIAKIYKPRTRFRALQTLRDQGRGSKFEDVARLSLLVHSNLNVLGSYSFDLSPEVERGEFRPLRQIELKI